MKSIKDKEQKYIIIGLTVFGMCCLTAASSSRTLILMECRICFIMRDGQEAVAEGIIPFYIEDLYFQLHCAILVSGNLFISDTKWQIGSVKQYRRRICDRLEV